LSGDELAEVEAMLRTESSYLGSIKTNPTGMQAEEPATRSSHPMWQARRELHQMMLELSPKLLEVKRKCIQEGWYRIAPQSAAVPFHLVGQAVGDSVLLAQFLPSAKAVVFLIHAKDWSEVVETVRFIADGSKYIQSELDQQHSHKKEFNQK
jgi:uncharacterized membrane protein